jgi:transcriptional regulator of acetoin/glycerol metabolism
VRATDSSGEALIDAETLARMPRAREEFLSTGEVPEGVRDVIGRSWKRSLRARVDPDAPVLPFVSDLGGHSVLAEAATPVARSLLEEIADPSAAIVLTNQEGCVLRRWLGSVELGSHFDSSAGGPGYVYAESVAGTNAIGTTLEDAHPVVISGHEFFASMFHSLAAVGAPILHPATGRVEGVLDLVCRIECRSPMMGPLIGRAARETAERLLSGYAAADRALLDGFFRIERRGPRRATVAINSRLLITNRPAADMMIPLEQPHLWEEARRALRDRRKTIPLDLGGERPATVKVTGIDDGGANVGAVVEFISDRARAAGEEEGAGGARQRVALEPRRVRRVLERAVGASELWRGSVERSLSALSERGRVLLLGESGVGKQALGSALAEALETGTPIEHDARAAFADEPAWTAEVSAGLEAAGKRTVILRHLEQLSSRALASVCYAVDAVRAGHVVATFTLESEEELSDPRLLATFAEPVELPPLRQHVEDLAQLATRILAEVASPAAARFDPAALRALSRRDWPGNVAELRWAVETAYAAAPGSVIREVDLPAVSTPACSRTLTRLERVERETILAVLSASGGNKRLAAANLGISRSTLYRRLSVLGIEP